MLELTPPPSLRIPAILQNSRDRSVRQVEAYNAQQREKAAARREQRKEEVVAGPSKRGKRFTQRLNNSQFIDNPHISAPRRGDYAPSVPLHQRPLRPAFPADAIERSAPIAGSAGSRRDPLGASSRAGAFSTSLKGTRALLRRGGRRAEVIVPALEGAVRGWLGGELSPAADDGSWRVLEATPVALAASQGTSRANGTHGHRVPPQHRVAAPLPPLPVTDGHVPALLELSRSAAHLSLAVPDSFDRLVVHLVARYYDLVSWSEDERAESGEVVRLTHLLRPAVGRARPLPASHALVTPETSEMSGHSASEATERESDGSVTEHEDAASEPDTSFRSISERFGLVGDDDDEGWEEEEAEYVAARFGELGLHRTTSHGSSAYAGSEGGMSETEALADSVLHADDERSSVGGSERSPTASTVASPVSSVRPLPPVRRGPPQRLGGNGDWEDKPTFFDYLFGE
ncbi:hypothetical protein VHUM_00330 [Vanrija humicola]|uniref:R3H-associated N-terminal domain-containing protein n=1 Tax=Vanrija humicola TaxID=5417 RepID=A0A7D9A145_VANHU|nr:hypothetical protein VHUM_00330 [Vanrija humicola]